MSIAEVRSDVAKLASTMNFDFVKVPAELARMPVMDAIHARLMEDVAAFGGYALLARALPSRSAKVWQGKIECTARYKLLVDDFMQLIKLFGDPVLIALLGYKKGLGLIDLSSIPASEFGRADLLWSLNSLNAEAMLACCEFRENLLDGVDCSAARAKLGQFAKQAVVLLKQMELVLKTQLKQ